MSEENIVQPVDEEIKLEISSNKLVARLDFTPPKDGGKEVTVEGIRAFLKENNVTYGIIEENLESLSDPKERQKGFVDIAIGKEVVNGEDAFVEYNFATLDVSRPVQNADGSVNFFDLNLIQNVKEGDLLATLTPSTQGVDGISVLGEILKAKDGKNLQLSVGKNTKLSDDKLQLFAEVNGQLVNTQGKLSVQTIYEVSGDIDSTTGNIEFLGSIVVRGNVRTGFKLKADGNIEITGAVEGATLEATGDIIINGGMQGSSIGSVTAGGNLAAKYIENSKVDVKGDILSDAIMHSNVRCAGIVEVKGKKGLVVGGVVEAFRGLKAKVIGSHMATQTEIIVGLNPEIAELYRTKREEYKNQEGEINKTNQIINILSKKRDQGVLPPEQLAMLEKAEKTRDYLKSQLPELLAEIEELKAKLDEVNNYYIEASERVYTGVRVNIANEKRLITDELSSCRLLKRDNEIKLEAY